MAGPNDTKEDLDRAVELDSQYDKDDAAKDTDSDRSEVDQAWSDAASEGDDG